MNRKISGQITIEEYIRSLHEQEDFSQYMNEPEEEETCQQSN